MTERTTIFRQRGQTYEIRIMAHQDIPAFLALENEVWGGEACSEQNIRSRINIFPEGQLVAVSGDGRIVGYNGLQSVDSLWEATCSWAEITGNGSLITHVASGQYLFGVSLTAQGGHAGLGTKLLKAGKTMVSSYNKKGLFIGSRVPNFKTAFKYHSIEQWVHGADARSFDGLVGFFQKNDFSIVRIIADYFDDPHSCNYGVLMYWGS